MRRRIALSIALALGVSVSLVSLPATAQAQQQQRRFFAYDTGVLTPGAGQILRVTVAGGHGDDAISVRFRRVRYMAEGCNTDGVCRHSTQQVMSSSPLLLNSSEAAYIDVPGDGNGVRVVVGSTSRDVRATASIINTLTGETVSHIIMANTEGDF